MTDPPPPAAAAAAAVGTDSDRFKALVRGYIDLHDELAESAKSMSELRRRKEAMGEELVRMMRENDVDALQLGDGKLVRRVSKRTEPLKRDHIVATLAKVMSPDAAELTTEKMFASRAVVSTEALTRTKNRS